MPLCPSAPVGGHLVCRAWQDILNTGASLAHTGDLFCLEWVPEQRSQEGRLSG